MAMLPLGLLTGLLASHDLKKVAMNKIERDKTKIILFYSLVLMVTSVLCLNSIKWSV
jgi:hypothetical protein